MYTYNIFYCVCTIIIYTIWYIWSCGQTACNIIIIIIFSLTLETPIVRVRIFGMCAQMHNTRNNDTRTHIFRTDPRSRATATRRTHVEIVLRALFVQYAPAGRVVWLDCRYCAGLRVRLVVCIYDTIWYRHVRVWKSVMYMNSKTTNDGVTVYGAVYKLKKKK